MYAKTADTEITKTERNKVPRGENVHQSRDSMNEKLPQSSAQEAERESAPDEQPFEGGENVVALRMHGARATMVTPRSSLLRKSVRVDRGDVGPPSNIERRENC